MKKKADDRFGINMKQFCRMHESRLEELREQNGITDWLIEYHMEKLRWLQHERLVHLIVLVMTVFIEVFIVYLTLFRPETAPYSGLFLIGLAILLVFYFIHYFFLENTVQHWYRIGQEMMEECLGPHGF